MNQTFSHDLDQLCINTARILSVDMSEKAHSGHPGLPLGAEELRKYKPADTDGQRFADAALSKRRDKSLISF